MKKLLQLMILIIATSCASRKPLCTEESQYSRKLEDCMVRFSNQGYTAEGVVKICGKAHEKRD